MNNLLPQEELTNKLNALRQQFQNDCNDAIRIYFAKVVEPSPPQGGEVRPHPKEKEETNFSYYAKVFEPSPPPKVGEKVQPPKEKEEFNEAHEWSDRNFVVDDDDEQGLDEVYEEPSSSSSVPSPVLKKRARRITKKVIRYEDEDDEDDDEGDLCSSSSNQEDDQWALVCNKPLSELKRNPWFKRQFMDHFETIRSNLGLEGNNALAQMVWDNIADHPNQWSFERISTYKDTCALCGYTKWLYTKAIDSQKKKEYFFSSCCGPLARSWQHFNSVLFYKGPLPDLEGARDAVIAAQALKGKRKK